jgi:hypothetical protein
MKDRNAVYMFVSVVFLMVMGVGLADAVSEAFYSDPNDFIPETVFEDFEYIDANDFNWRENNGNAVISLVPSDSNDFHQVMNYAYSCGKAPYFTEAYTIFSEAQDWSIYDTFSMWVKGKISLQSLEDMYVVLYTATDPNDSMSHADLKVLGTARFYKVTQLPNWTYWRADIDFQFDSLKEVWGIGIGMMPVSYGAGVIQVDNLAVGNTGLGGMIDNFETYADTSEMLLYVTPDAANCTISLEDAEVYSGNHSLKVLVNNSIPDYFGKVSLKEGARLLGANWNALDYKTMTVYFKVVDPEGSIRIGLFDNGGARKVTYPYNGGALVPAGDWVRWDIELRDPAFVPDITALNNIARVDIEFKTISYGTGEFYFDNIYVNKCGLESNLCNDDCFVNMLDFAVLASQWGRTDCAAPDYCQGADFLINDKRNGTVDISDAAVLIGEWLQCELLYENDCFL